MLTVALIGPDGSGKTTIARRLLESLPVPVKYLYMGVSVESSNVALPTSRLVHAWKVYRHKRSLKTSGAAVPAKISLHSLEHRVDRRGKLGAVGRLVNRISEESYRQVISWIYQLRGYIVLYDRHFFFDVGSAPSKKKKQRLTERIHNWFLWRVYPRPQLVIFLDAPPEVLYQRKREVPTEYLQQVRERLLEKGSHTANFVRIDTTQPIDTVLASVVEIIMQHCSHQPSSSQRVPQT